MSATPKKGIEFEETGGEIESSMEGNSIDDCDSPEMPFTPVSDPVSRPAAPGRFGVCYGPGEGYLSSRLKPAIMQHVSRQWGVRVSDSGVNAMLFSLGFESAVQRVVYVPFDGSEIRFIVHGEVLPTTHEVYFNSLINAPVKLSEETFEDFVSVMLSALYAVQQYNMCVAIDSPDFVDEWPKHRNCRLDENKFRETGYVKTLRPVDCELLVERRKKKCGPCSKYLDNLKEREARRSDEVKPQTGHDFLSRERHKQIFKTKQIPVREQSAKIKYQAERIAKLVEKDCARVDDELHEDLSTVMNGNASNMPGLAKIFWEEQKKAHVLKDSRGMRWHPFMLRYALHMKSMSSTAYRKMRASGFIKLPSERPLYEFSHVYPTKEGIQEHVIKRISEIVREFDDDFKKYHVVMFDEMYVFKSVVYHKDTGNVVGYVTLDEIESELLELEEALEEEETIGDLPSAATLMLTYTVKGIANGAKDVVAFFRTAGLNVDELFLRTRDVIWNLEKAGIKVIALVSDGSAVIHSFFQRLPPYTKTTSNVVFDSLNIYAAEERPIFFFNDTPHLITTIRNCFANSGAHLRSRLMMKNNEFITWQTIIDIFQREKGEDVRYCHKLSNDHVNLNSGSALKVFVATQVLSRTVAAYIEKCNIPGTSETVNFIRKVNDWFDCLNGAHCDQALKTRNQRLAKYEDENDARFNELLEFLNYIQEWEEEVNHLNLSNKEKKRKQLSPQAKNGIERTVRSFIGATKFLLKQRKSPGVGYIMARIFQQDPLGHYYSQHR